MTRSIVALIGLASTFCVAFGDDKDPVKDKLFAAKKAWDADMDQFRKQVGEWFDRREESARKDGNKKTLDQIKDERKTFEENGELPKGTPMTIQQKSAAMRRKMEAAYTEAIKAYVKAKKDDEVVQLEKELEEFRKFNPSLPSDPFQERSVWMSDNKLNILTVLERKDDTFRAKLVAGEGIEREVSGKIKNGKMNWLAKDVNAKKGGQGLDNYGTFMTDKDGDKIAFTYGSASNPNVGMFTLRLVKDK